MGFGKTRQQAKTGYAKTPTVFQMEATECGAASLSMIFGYYGRYVPLEQMRVETGVSRDGCNAANIMKAGIRAGLEVHAYRKDIEGLKKLPVPCIIHWEFNHFVVYEGVKGKNFYINDPAMGRRKLTYEELSGSFTGIVITFAPTPAFEASYKENRMLGMVMNRLKGEGSTILSLVLMGLFLVVPGMLIPVFTQIFVDEILIGGNRSWLSGLILAMILTILYEAGFTWYRGVILQRLQNKMALLSGDQMIRHLFRLPIVFFDQRYAGDLSKRVENNNNLSLFLTSDLAQTVLNILTAAFFVILMIFYNPLLTVIGVAFVLVTLLIMKNSASAISDLTMKGQIDQGKFMGTLMAGLTITQTLKASGSEDRYIERLQGYYAKNCLSEQKLGFRQEILNAIPTVSDNLTSITVLVVGGIMVIRGDLTAGMLVAFTQLLAAFSEPVNELAGFIQRIQLAKADLSRVDDIMRYGEDQKYAEEEKLPMEEKLVGDIRLNGISFGYGLLDEPLISDFSFDLPCGSSIAFVGASGSGKSTMSKLCSGLYQPWSGEILFDGVKAQSIPKEVFAASVSTVSQNITLFAGTIRDNLTMWNRYISDQDIVQACKDACIHDVITNKPGAYDYELAEGGSNLSGGQRQRLEIARALATNPSILIMDEATSALDPIVEKKIIDNIKRRGCTCIIVAHRLSAIRDCDEIIVMEHGRIVQRGSHEELKDIPGHYQKLIQTM